MFLITSIIYHLTKFTVTTFSAVIQQVPLATLQVRILGDRKLFSEEVADGSLFVQFGTKKVTLESDFYKLP